MYLLTVVDSDKYGVICSLLCTDIKQITTIFPNQKRMNLKEGF